MMRILIPVIILLIACSRHDSDDVKSFIPGTYVKRVSNEYNDGTDTLIILSEHDDLYRITRVLSIQKIREGEVMPPVKKTEKWTAIYNKEDKALHETQEGKIISFLINEKKLLVERSEYKKIKSR